jgi:hypothetical protein
MYFPRAARFDDFLQRDPQGRPGEFITIGAIAHHCDELIHRGFGDFVPISTSLPSLVVLLLLLGEGPRAFELRSAS